MKTLAIASIVGSLILYVYLALVHMVIPIHESDYKYTAAHDTIMSALNAAHLEDGYYFLQGMRPGASHEEMEKAMKEMAGKPYAMVIYHNSMDEGATMFIMSFVYNFIAVLIICFALAASSDKLVNFRQRLWFVMLFAFFVIFSQILLDYNWQGYPMHYVSGQIIDVVLGYFLVGVWLAWYYGKQESKAA